MYLFWTASPATAEGRLPRFLGIGLPMLVLSGIASAMAVAWRGRIDRGLGGVLGFLIPGGLMLLLAGAVVTGFRYVPVLSHVFSGFSYEVRLGATLLALAFFNSMINQARSRERAQGIALRKRLASARRYFQEQLNQPRPALRDEWFPYVLAFGLDKDARNWFKAHGGESTSDSDRPWSGSPSSSSSSGSSSSSSAPWSGGGGSFGGAGATAAWAVAASSLASGVAAPSSSGSSSGGGGGGGGGSSSGGGGGGGW
jgi:uncharacterized membrane protein YgcG